MRLIRDGPVDTSKQAPHVLKLKLTEATCDSGTEVIINTLGSPLYIRFRYSSLMKLCLK